MKAEHLSRVIGDWIARKVHEAGAKGVVVGLSGGVDSAVVLALSRLGLGENVLGVIMGALDANRKPAPPAEAVRRVKALVEASGHKRALPAICPVKA